MGFTSNQSFPDSQAQTMDPHDTSRHSIEENTAVDEAQGMKHNPDDLKIKHEVFPSTTDKLEIKQEIIPSTADESKENKEIIHFNTDKLEIKQEIIPSTAGNLEIKHTYLIPAKHNNLLNLISYMVWGDSAVQNVCQ